jgi:hypothetical protein
MTELTTETTTAMRRAGTWRAYLRAEIDRGRQRTTTPPPAPQAPAPRSALDVPCPHCSAPTSRPCTTRSGRHGITGQHAARTTAYAALLARETA